jgi:DNA-directed RNA polymerase specialized sigma24 family protein
MAVLGGVEGFEGRRGATFATWVWQIYKNKVNDFFRSKYPDPVSVISYEINDMSVTLEDAETKIAITEIFKKHLPHDKTGCIRLYLDLYRCFQKGQNQKDLAGLYQINPNTLNQRIKRCRKTIRRLFRELWDNPDNRF